MDINETYSKALAGELGPVPSALAWLREHPGELSLPWSLAFRSLASLLTPSLTAPPEPEEIAPCKGGGPDAVEIAAASCGHSVLRCVISFDQAGLETWTAALQDLVASADHPRSALWLSSAESWSCLMRGDLDQAMERSSKLRDQAAASGVAPLVIEATAQHALAALAERRHELALEIARRGSRMARTEELLTQEYLANIVLARARRYTGRSHLSSRILGALAQVAPTPWRRWILWELILAGTPPGAVERLAYEHPSDVGAPHHAVSMLEAAEAGRGEELRHARQQLSASVASFCPIAREAEALIAAVSPDASLAQVDEQTAAFLRGCTRVLPGAIHGLCSPALTDDALEIPGVFVIHTRRHGGRRVLRQGLGLIDPTTAQQPPTQSLAQNRVLTAIAVLALAGPEGLPLESFFEAVYGFAFVPANHQGVLRTLLYRARKEIEGRGQIVKVDFSLTLVADDLLVAPDPRCTPDLEELILRTLVFQGGRASARKAASALGVPLRTVQAALQHLVEDGACTAEREGRLVEYQLEDTTFSEPTLHRLSPRGVP